MFCGMQWSKIWESEVQRANRIYCVRRAERSDSGVRVQRALRIFEKFIHIIPFLVGFLLLYLIFFVLKNGRGAGGEFHFSKILILLSFSNSQKFHQIYLCKQIQVVKQESVYLLVCHLWVFFHKKI